MIFPECPVVLRGVLPLIISDNRYYNTDKEGKTKMTKILLSPLKATDEEIESFINDVIMA